MAAVPSATAVLSGLEVRRGVLVASLGTLEAEQEKLARRHDEMAAMLASLDAKIDAVHKNMAIENMKAFLNAV